MLLCYLCILGFLFEDLFLDFNRTSEQNNCYPKHLSRINNEVVIDIIANPQCLVFAEDTTNSYSNRKMNNIFNIQGNQYIVFDFNMSSLCLK